MWVACGVRSRPAPEYPYVTVASNHLQGPHRESPKAMRNFSSPHGDSRWGRGKWLEVTVPYVYTKPTSASGIAHPSSQRRGLGIPDRLTNSIRNAMFGLSKLLQQHAVNRLSFFAKKRPPIDRFGLSFSLEYRAWKWNMATAKPRKRIKYSQQWKDSYRDKYPCLEQYCYRDLTGKKVVDSLRATCTVCKCDFGICHGGLTDCRRHCESEAHVKNSAKRKGVVKLTAFVDSRPENTEELQAVRASALLGLFIVETNQSISSADTLAKLAPHMFPDSNIAAKMTSGRSKTTAVIKVNYFVICFNLMHFCLTEAIENVGWNLYDFDIYKNCYVHWD